MAAQHTPGPWRLERTTGGHPAVIGSAPLHPRGGLVAELVAVGQSDARLIAAAPDLLAALREVAEATSGTSADALGQLVDLMRDTARAAIAKAEGRA